MAIKGLSGTHVANLQPNREQEKQKIGTITGIRNWNEFTWPDPIISEHSNPQKSWNIPKIDHQDTDTIESLENQMNELKITDVNSINETEIDLERKSWEIFISGWALQQNQKTREPVKRIPIHVKNLLEIMFHAGTANPRKKMTAAEMRSELLQRVQEGEIDENEVPKESTIANWITSFSRG
ncbi:unnamed protein product [Rhizophagus irregularis]|nr:unnamed protein product [Rhizophagus irregularis]